MVMDEEARTLMRRLAKALLPTVKADLHATPSAAVNDVEPAVEHEMDPESVDGLSLLMAAHAAITATTPSRG